MYLSPFWHSAARLSGRVDLCDLRQRLARPGPPPSVQELADAGLTVRVATRLHQHDGLQLSDPALRLVDPAYPPQLACLPHAPPVLFLRGRIDLLAEPMVAIVGSRRCTQAGLRLARGLARTVVDAGGVVVSGLAHGIDHAAQAAVPGRTVAVLGQGLAQPFTHRQQQLADRILDAGGLLVTEFPPQTPAARWTFPQRNRVIAGLSHGTVVVEAGLRSGALITARQALGFGREVMAVPGSPLSPASRGCLELLSQGAAVLRELGDIRSLLPAPAPATAPAGGPPLPPALAQGLRQGASLDRLAALSGLGIAELASTLAALELSGVVERLPGDCFAFRQVPG